MKLYTEKAMQKEVEKRMDDFLKRKLMDERFERIEKNIESLRNDLCNLDIRMQSVEYDAQSDHEVCETIKRSGAIRV